MPKVSIVIPSFNEERYLRECLDAIFKLNYDLSAVEIILVDNGSTDKTVDIAKSFPIKVLIKKDVKVGGVRNYGAEHATGEHLVFLDSDCVVETDWLSKGITQLESSPRAVLGGQYLMRDNPSWLEKYWVLTNSKEQIYQTTLVGGCIFISRKIFIEMGGFNSTLNSGEDSDLTYRLINSNYIVKIDPQLSVIHLGYPSEIMPFIKRQIWHSSDYITNIKAAIKDKIFLLTLIFMSGVVSSFLHILLTQEISILAAAAAFLPPIILSYKRVSRSKVRIQSAIDWISIYLVDALYLTGRSCGIILSFKKAITQTNEQKVSRR